MGTSGAGKSTGKLCFVFDGREGVVADLAAGGCVFRPGGADGDIGHARVL